MYYLNRNRLLYREKYIIIDNILIKVTTTL